MADTEVIEDEEITEEVETPTAVAPDINPEWLSWTAQQETGLPDERLDASLEPVHYLPGQLPDPQTAVDAFFTPQDVSRLVVDEDAADHPNGPEPGELAVLGEREDTDNPSGAIEPDIDMTAPTAIELNPPTVDAGTLVVEPTESAPVLDEGEGIPPESWSKREIQEWADARGIAGVDMDSQSKAEMIAAIEGAVG